MTGLPINLVSESRTAAKAVIFTAQADDLDVLAKTTRTLQLAER
jgi:hypothetical protein